MNETLKQNRDICYIYSLLCEASYLFYNLINHISIFPAIFGGSFYICLNLSDAYNESIEYTNIVDYDSISILLAITTQHIMFILL
jgi:hypothetical protein